MSENHPHQPYLVIGDSLVDISRRRLRHAGQEQSLEPRVLQVLELLASRAGEVVSRQALHEQIWGRTVVETSALQRCIAQLRKALGDTGREQKVIATYPKKGYSLVADISWHEHPPGEAPSQEPPKEILEPAPKIHQLQEETSPTGPESQPTVDPVLLSAVPTEEAAAETPMAPEELLPRQQGISGQPVFQGLFSLPSLSFAGVMAVVLIASFGLRSGEDSSGEEPAQGAVVTPELPAESSFVAAYSPDGGYVVYPRSENGNAGHLWARRLADNREFRLTPTPGSYSWPTWSPEGTRLAFTARGTCNGVMVVDMNAAGEFTAPAPFVPCSAGIPTSPQWLNESTLALIELESGSAQVVAYQAGAPGKSQIYQQPGVSPYHLSYSKPARQLAVAGQTRSGEVHITLLDLVSGTRRDVYSTGERLPGSALIYPVWSPDANSLLLTDNGETLMVGLDGEIRRQVFSYLPSQPAEL